MSGPTQPTKPMKRRLLDRLLLAARVEAVKQVAPRLRQVTLAGPELAGLAWIPGQHVRLQVGPTHPSFDWLVGTLRTYSVWDYDGQKLELIVFDHGDTNGPGADWGRSAQPGDELMLLKPEGSFVTGEAGYHLFVGDETAQVAFGPMVRALPADARVFGCVEVDTPQERLDLGRELHFGYRRGMPAASSTTLVASVQNLDLPTGPGLAYLAGEARTIQMVRRHLVEERNWPRRNVRTKPFWTPGRKGLD